MGGSTKPSINISFAKKKNAYKGKGQFIIY